MNNEYNQLLEAIQKRYGIFGTDANIALALTPEQACNELNNEEFEVYLQELAKIHEPQQLQINRFEVVNGVIQANNEDDIDG